MKLAECFFHFLPQMPVQIGERLIQQHHIRFGHKATCECHALPLPAGKFGWTPLRIGLKPNGGQRICHLLPIALTRNATDLERITSIFGHRHVRP